MLSSPLLTFYLRLSGATPRAAAGFAPPCAMFLPNAVDVSSIWFETMLMPILTSQVFHIAMRPEIAKYCAILQNSSSEVNL